MINIAMTKNPMPEQDPAVRKENFLEVCEGYTEEMAIREAMRCLRCRKKPCMNLGCPVHNHIPDFIAKVAEADFEAAYKVLEETTSLPAVCGRVCNQADQCEGSCVRGVKGEPVGIGNLERFVADWHKAHNAEPPAERPASNGHKVAVVGAGPAGLACAGDLAKKGYAVTVYEKTKVLGGVMTYGIPEFRLPDSIVESEVSDLKARGINFVTEKVVGKDISVDDLKKEGYEAVFIGNGAGVPSTMGIPGEDLSGVFVASDYLDRINLERAYDPASKNPLPKAKWIAVVGGGNVAMDAARSAVRTGAKVSVVYRRSEKEMPANAVEVKEARDEGIEFLFLTNPVAVKGANGKVSGIECVRMELGAPDESGRRRPVEIKGSNFTLDVDQVIMAIGTKFDPSVAGSVKDLKTTPKGGIVTDDNSTATSCAGIYAGGDTVTGPLTVVHAMAAGKKAAVSMDAYISGK